MRLLSSSSSSSSSVGLCLLLIFSGSFFNGGNDDVVNAFSVPRQQQQRRQQQRPQSLLQPRSSIRLYQSQQQPSSQEPPEVLAKEGDWEAYLDESTTGLIYYFNSRTGESRWEAPTTTFPDIYLKASKRRIARAKREEYQKALRKQEKEDAKKGLFSIFLEDDEDDATVTLETTTTTPNEKGSGWLKSIWGSSKDSDGTTPVSSTTTRDSKTTVGGTTDSSSEEKEKKEGMSSFLGGFFNKVPPTTTTKTTTTTSADSSIAANKNDEPQQQPDKNTRISQDNADKAIEASRIARAKQALADQKALAAKRAELAMKAASKQAQLAKELALEKKAEATQKLLQTQLDLALASNQASQIERAKAALEEFNADETLVAAANRAAEKKAKVQQEEAKKRERLEAAERARIERERERNERKAKQQEERKARAEAAEKAERARVEQRAEQQQQQSQVQQEKAKRIAEEREAAAAARLAQEEKRLAEQAAAAAEAEARRLAELAEQEEEEEEEEEPAIKVTIGSYVLPHPAKVFWGGEDAVFVKGSTFGVFDGVSGATKLDGKPLYSKTLAKQFINNLPGGDVASSGILSDVTVADLIEQLSTAAAFANEKATGASTACVGSISSNGFLRVINLGDCCCYVLRDQKVVHRSRRISHYFDCPYQLSTDSPDRPTDSTKLNVELVKGDIIMMASDGIFDNISDKEIIDIVYSTTDTKPKSIAKRLSDISRKVSLNPKSATPYAKEAKKNKDPDYRDGLGGKVDDISCIIARCE